MTIPRIESYELPTRSDLPSCRMHGQLDPSRAALLIHDMQNYFLDFFAPSSTLTARVLGNIRRLRQTCYDLHVPVIYTAQPAKQSPAERGLLQDMWGPGITARPERDEIHSALTPRHGDLVITKWRYSAFSRSPLRACLLESGRDQLIICGVYAHIGCQCTAADAFMGDVLPVLVSDAVADFSRARHLDALDYVASCCGLVRDTDAVLAELNAPTSSTRVHPIAADAALERRIANDVAGVLKVAPETLDSESNLFEQGLDSVRLMTLVEQWSAAGYVAEIVEFAEEPTLAAWTRKLASSSEPEVQR